MNDEPHKLLTQEFPSFPGTSAGEAYGRCLREFVTTFLHSNVGNVDGIILYGGLVRDERPMPLWSDIDLVIIFGDLLARDPLSLGQMVQRAEQAYDIRIDVTQIDAKTLSDPVLLSSCFNGELINSLAMRPNVSRLIFGSLTPVSVSCEQERLAAVIYLEHTLGLIRRFMTEQVARLTVIQDRLLSFKRLTRWLFSILRASLRLFGIFVHPYRESLDKLAVLFPDLDLSLPEVLLGMRAAPETICADDTMLTAIASFAECYVPFVLRKNAVRTPLQPIRIDPLPRSLRSATHAGD